MNSRRNRADRGVAVDGAAVAALMVQRDLDDGQVAHRMRRCGLPGTTAHWVSMVRRGVWGDMRSSWVAGLAAALGADQGEILGRPRLYVVAGEHEVLR